MIICNQCHHEIKNYSGLHLCESCMRVNDRLWWNRQREKAESVKEFYKITLPDYYAMTSGLKESK